MDRFRGLMRWDICEKKLKSSKFMADNKGKIIAVTLLSAATMIAAYFGFIYKFEDNLTGWQKLTKKKPESEPKKDDAIPGTSTITSSGGGTSSTSTLPSGDYPIKYGDKNALVLRLQKALKGVWKQTGIGKVDGDFGNKTLTALKATGYGESVKNTATLTNIELNVKPASSAPTGYGVLAANKIAYAKITGNASAYDLSKGASSSMNIMKDMPVGSIKRLVGDSVYVDVLGKQWTIDKKFVYTM